MLLSITVGMTKHSMNEVPPPSPDGNPLSYIHCQWLAKDINETTYPTTRNGLAPLLKF